MSCERFRSRFAPATEDAELLGHIRVCDNCLTAAVEADPDILFRALGGTELVPPGGIDPFVDDVMREVRLRSTETAMTRRPVSWTRRLAIAATVALAILGATAIQRFDGRASAPLSVQRASLRPLATATRPAVEAYESVNATIVEVPAEGVGDVRVVMVFDETLPADL